MHYHRQYRHGSVDARAPRLAPVDRPHYRTMRAVGHPLAGKHGLVYVHRAVLYDCIGPGPHSCHWCGTEVDWLPRGDARCLQADHLNGDRYDNAAGNLVQSCGRCNTTRALQARHESLRALGFWSEHDTVARLSRGGRQPAVVAGAAGGPVRVLPD